MSSSASLIEAYCRTTYEIAGPWGVVDVRLGVPHDRLDDVLAAEGVSRWAILTAANPESLLCSETENAARHEELLAVAARSGWRWWPTSTAADDGAWPAEHGLCLLQVPRGEALHWGGVFRQYAIVWGELGRAPTLLLPAPQDLLPALQAATESVDAVVRQVAVESLAQLQRGQ